jgi:hypothetical protein
MKKSLLTAAFVFALAAPALAAGQFYVALDTSTRECHVMDTRPDGTTQKMGAAARTIPKRKLSRPFRA